MCVSIRLNGLSNEGKLLILSVQASAGQETASEQLAASTRIYGPVQYIHWYFPLFFRPFLTFWWCACGTLKGYKS